MFGACFWSVFALQLHIFTLNSETHTLYTFLSSVLLCLEMEIDIFDYRCWCCRDVVLCWKIRLFIIEWGTIVVSWESIELCFPLCGVLWIWPRKCLKIDETLLSGVIFYLCLRKVFVPGMNNLNSCVVIEWVILLVKNKNSLIEWSILGIMWRWAPLHKSYWPTTLC